jgi:hypothetical protein
MTSSSAEPLAALEPSGHAATISYSVPEPTSYSGRNCINIAGLPDEAFSTVVAIPAGGGFGLARRPWNCDWKHSGDDVPCRQAALSAHTCRSREASPESPESVPRPNPDDRSRLSHRPTPPLSPRRLKYVASKAATGPLLEDRRFARRSTRVPEERGFLCSRQANVPGQQASRASSRVWARQPLIAYSRATTSPP